MKILVLNPGSTTTKIAVFEDTDEVYSYKIDHSVKEIQKYDKLIDQYEFRERIILEQLSEADIQIKDIDAVIGRGGLVRPIDGGVYRVNDEMISDLKNAVMGEHASNLGAILASEIAPKTNNNDNAFIADPVVVDEMEDVARISGNPNIDRISIFHALNQKAVSRRYAGKIDKKYEDLNLIVAHIGGGVSVGAHKKGKVVDVNNALDGDGPFSPERSGQVPVGSLVKMCFSGDYTYKEIYKMIKGNGGLVGYLNTNDAREVEKRIDDGDEEAKLVYRAMAYQISKEIGADAAVLNGNVDAIILTGGVAHNKRFCNWIKEKVDFIADVEVFPGEDEMKALTEAAYEALEGEIEIKTYNIDER